MPSVQVDQPQLVEVVGDASRAVSNGRLFVRLVVTPGPDGWPPEAELDAALLDLFARVAPGGWLGTVSKRYTSGMTLIPDDYTAPDQEAPQNEREYPPGHPLYVGPDEAEEEAEATE